MFILFGIFIVAVLIGSWLQAHQNDKYVYCRKCCRLHKKDRHDPFMDHHWPF